MAKKKATAKPKKKATMLRGAALARAVIAKLGTKRVAKRLAPAAIAKLTMPGGAPLPPSLATFLAHDDLRVLDAKGKLRFQSFDAMMESEFDASVREMYSGFDVLLPGKCLVLPGGTDSRRFMYAGLPDEHGEYPVFVVDTDDTPFVCIAYPGVDVYLSDGTVAKVIEKTYTDASRNPAYKKAIADQARRNFHGMVGFGYSDMADTTVDGEPTVGVLERLFAKVKARSPLRDFLEALRE